MAVFVAEDEAFVVAALKAGLVPEAIASSPVSFEVVPEGIALQPLERVASADRKHLLGIGFGTRRSLDGGERRACWAEVVSPRPGAEPEPPLPHVLLLCPRAEAASLVGALLRLGCDDQQLCFFTDEDGTERVACRAVAPPYYVVLAAFERGGTVEAYLPVQGRPQIWIAAGYEHPLASELVAPEGQLALVRIGAAWRRIPDGPWRSVAQHTTLEVPPAESLEAIESRERYRVELTLARSSSTDTPTLWVLRGDAIAAVDRLVASLPAEALGGLAFAALQTSDGTQVVAIRARRLGRSAPPALELPGAQTYATLPLLERIHVPLNTTVAPPLRVERLAEALAPDPDRLVWLERTDDASFRVESAPDEAFVPLAEWVDHVASEHAEPLKRWMSQAVFEFEPFTADADAKRGAREDDDKPKRTRRRTSAPPPEESEPSDTDVLPQARQVSAGPRPVRLEVQELEPSERAKELARIEEEILEHDGEPDDPVVTSAWAALASGYAAGEQGMQAGLAFVHALWDTPAGELYDARAHAWVQAEGAMAGAEAFTLVDDPSPDRVRAVAARVIAGDTDDAATIGWLREHDERLTTRAYWLLWEKLSNATGDTLARVRATDAVLARLRGGLSARDVPTFVRGDSGSGEGGSSITGQLADELQRTREQYAKTKRKRSTVEASPALTDGYVQFVFGWGFGRLGRDEDSRRALELADELHRELPSDDSVHAFLRAAYRERVAAALEGLALETPLSSARVAELEALERYDRYKVDRLRQASLILDWSPHVDPFSEFGARDKKNDIAVGDAQPETLAAAVDARLADLGDAPADALARVVALVAVLPGFLAVPRLEPMLGAVGALEPDARIAPLEGITLIAGRCEHWPTVGVACQRFEALMSEDGLTDRTAPALALSRLSGTLRRANQTRQVLEMLGTQYEALAGNEVGPVTARLQLATAMTTLGDASRLDTATAVGLELLGSAALIPAARLGLTRQLMLALGRGSPEQAIAGVRALLKGLKTITDSFNTNSHFCLSVLAFVESLVLGLARPDVLGSERARRFVDNDEHRLRQRLFATT